MRTPSCGRASYSLCATVQATPSSSVRVGETLFPQFKAIPTAVLPAPSQKRLVRHCLTNPEVSLLAPSERSFSDCCKILQEDLSSTGSCQRIYAPARSCSATPPNVFSTEKRRVRISLSRRPCGSCPRSEPPCSMPPICGPRLGQMDWAPRSSPPGHSGMVPQPKTLRSRAAAPSPGHHRRFLAQAECLDTNSARPGPTPHVAPSLGEGFPVAPTAKAWNRPERPQHDPARRGSPMRAVDYLVVEPRPGPPQSSCLRPGYPPSAEPVPPEPTAPASPCPNPSNPIGIQHPFITHLISERYTNNRRFI